ncbi:MAG: PQQ-binding-like beta-propeller repeat protein [Candidatus Eremiobacterota bacterium]
MKLSVDLPAQIKLDLLQIEELNNPKFSFNFCWKFKTGDAIISSPFFWKNTVFVNSSDGYLYAIDGEKGEEKWKRKLLKDERDLSIECSPVISSYDRLYVSSFRNLYAIDVNSGSIILETDGFFNRSSLCLTEKKLFASQRNLFCAYNPVNLDKIWEFKADSYLETSPCISHNMVFLGSEGYKIYALDIDSGKLLWQFQTGNPVEATPFVYKDTLFIGSRDQNLYALNMFDGTKKWNIELDGEICCTSTVYRGIVYAATVLGNIYAFNATNGQLKWKSDVSGTIYSSPVIDKGIIYLGSSGRIKKLNAISISTGQVLWDFDISGELFSSPFLADNNIYITSMDSYVYSFSCKPLAGYIEEEEILEEEEQNVSEVMEKRVAVEYSPVSKKEEKTAEVPEKKEKDDLSKDDLKIELRKKRQEMEEKLKARAREAKAQEEERNKEEIKLQKMGAIEERLRVQSQTRRIDESFRFEVLKRLEEKNKSHEQIVPAKTPVRDDKKKSEELARKIKEQLSKKKKDSESRMHKTGEKAHETPEDKAGKFFTVGKTQLEKNMIDAAISSFRRALELMPDDINYVISLGDALREKGDLHGACECYEKAFAISPERQDIALTLSSMFMIIGRKALADRLYDNSFDYFNRSIRVRENAGAYFGQADVYIVRGDTGNFIKAILKGLKCDNSDFERLTDLAEIYSFTELDQEDCYNKMLSLSGLKEDSSRASFLKGIIYEKNDWEEAAGFYEHAIYKDQNFPEPYYRMGMLFLQEELYQEAEDMFKRIIKINPSYGKAYAGLGKLFVKKGDFIEAEKNIKKAISIDPIWYYSYCLLAKICLKNNHIDEALGYIEKIKGIHRTLPDVHIIQGEIFLKKKSQNDACKCFFAAINSWASTWEHRSEIAMLSPLIDDADVLTTLIESFNEEEDSDLLKIMYERLLALKPDNKTGILKLARIYRNSNKYDNAIELFRGLPSVTREMSIELAENFYRKSRKELKQGKLKSAIVSIKSAIKFVKNNGPYYAHAGDIYFKSEKYPEAVEAYLNSIDIEKDSSVYFKLGQTYEKIEDYREAIKAYEEAIKLEQEKVSYYANLARASYKIKHYSRVVNLTREVFGKFHDLDEKVKTRLENLQSLSENRLWISFRGNKSAFQEHEENLKVSSLKDENSFLALNWTLNLKNRITSSPVVSDGSVYIVDEGGTLYAVSQKKGKPVWKFNSGSENRATPFAGGRMIYVASGNGFIYGVDISKGTKVWDFKAESKINSSPAGYENILYTGSDKGIFYALSMEKGELLWSYKTGEQITSLPLIVSDLVYFGSWDGFMYCLNRTTGEKVWTKNLGGKIHSSPVFMDGLIYTGLLNNKVVALDGANGKIKWEFMSDGPVISSPAVAYKKVFIGSRDSSVYALDAFKGTKIWQYKTKGTIYSSPAVANGFVYIGSTDMIFYAIHAEKGRGCKYKTGGKIMSSPAIANGMVFIASDDGRLYAFGSEKQ